MTMRFSKLNDGGRDISTTKPYTIDQPSNGHTRGLNIFFCAAVGRILSFGTVTVLMLVLITHCDHLTWGSPAGPNIRTLCFRMGPAGNWLPIYWPTSQ